MTRELLGSRERAALEDFPPETPFPFLESQWFYLYGHHPILSIPVRGRGAPAFSLSPAWSYLCPTQTPEGVGAQGSGPTLSSTYMYAFTCIGTYSGGACTLMLVRARTHTQTLTHSPFPSAIFILIPIPINFHWEVSPGEHLPNSCIPNLGSCIQLNID